MQYSTHPEKSRASTYSLFSSFAVLDPRQSSLSDFFSISVSHQEQYRTVRILRTMRPIQFHKRALPSLCMYRERRPRRTETFHAPGTLTGVSLSLPSSLSLPFRPSTILASATPLPPSASTLGARHSCFISLEYLRCASGLNNCWRDIGYWSV